MLTMFLVSGSGQHQGALHPRPQPEHRAGQPGHHPLHVQAQGDQNKPVITILLSFYVVAKYIY